MKRRRNTPFSLFSFQDIVTGLCGILIFFVLIMLVDLVVRSEGKGAPAVESVTLPTGQADRLAEEIAALRARLEALRAKTRSLILSQAEALAPEEAARLTSQLTEREREALALKSQLEALKSQLEKAEATDAEDRRRLWEMEATRRRLEEALAKLKASKAITLIPERGEVKAPLYIVLSGQGYDLLRPLGESPYRRHYPAQGFARLLSQELGGLDHTTHTVILLVRPSGVHLMQEAFTRVSALGFSCGRDPLEEDVEVRLPETEQEAP